MDYKKAYLVMFNAATDALEYMIDGSYRLARNVLMMAQWEAESIVISQPSQEDEVREADEIPEKHAPPQ